MNKFPKIPHLPWSDGINRDDNTLISVDHFSEIVVTEKMDGENITMARGYVHARSLDSDMRHPSRTWVTNLWASIRHIIPEDMRICGENLYAKHSIAYDALPSYFLVFGIFQGDVYLPWLDVYGLCDKLGLKTVPTLFTGVIDPNRLYPDTHKVLMKRGSYFGLTEPEGYVIRATGEIRDFSRNIAKYVRPNHVQTDEHWMYQTVEKNGLRK